MTKKIGDKKVGKVNTAHEAEHIQSTEGVFGIGQIKSASGVGTVNRAGGIGSRSPTRLMTLAEREELFKMVNEEAKTLFANSGLPTERVQALEQAVKMVIDSGLIEEKHQTGDKDKKSDSKKFDGKK